MQSTQVKVGILADSMTQPAWARAMLERVLAEGNASFDVVVLNTGRGPAEAPPAGILDRLGRHWRTRDRLLFRAFDRFDRRKFRTTPDAFEDVDVSDLLAGVPVVEVSPRRTKFSDFIEGDDLERVRAAGVDLFIRLGFRILRGGILTTAPLGVWSFHHGDNRHNRGGPAGYWEVFLGWSTTGSVLQILNEDLDDGLVLARSWSATHPLSPNLNRNNFYWKSAAMIPRKLAELARDGCESFLDRHRSRQPVVSLYSNRLFVKPTNREMLSVLARWIGRYVRLGLGRRLYRQQWQLRFSFRDAVLGSPWRYERVVPPKDRFWADPHLVYRDGRYFAFIEEKPNDAVGHISVMELREDGTFTVPERVIEQPYHLSYPFVFEWQGEIYMIPETADHGEIQLYRCREFPGSWELERTLMTGVCAVDATLLEHGGRWWMFVGMAEHPGASPHDELFLFSAPSPVSEAWAPHPMNPIVSDVTRARPAGPIFDHEGVVLRPAQDCSRSYGSSLRLMEIVELTPERYEEREVGHLTPDWEPGLEGTHSFAKVGRLNVIDVRKRERRFL